jgi:hypothetical protein
MCEESGLLLGSAEKTIGIDRHDASLCSLPPRAAAPGGTYLETRGETDIGVYKYPAVYLVAHARSSN